MTEGLIQVKLIRDLLKHISPRVKTLCSTSQLEQTKQGASNMPVAQPSAQSCPWRQAQLEGSPHSRLSQNMRINKPASRASAFTEWCCSERMQNLSHSIQLWTSPPLRAETDPQHGCSQGKLRKKPVSLNSSFLACFWPLMPPFNFDAQWQLFKNCAGKKKDTCWCTWTKHDESRAFQT